LVSDHRQQERRVDSSFIVRPPARPASRSTPVRGSVPASLAAAQSVTAVTKSAEARADDTAHVRDVVLDAQSREVVYRMLDSGERRAAGQPPEDVRQRLRAYVRPAKAGERRRHLNSDLDLEV
jgi:hypothetical protein